ELRDVTFQYEDSPSPALRAVNLTIDPGEVVLITGPSGSGKTTLCSCANGLIPHFHEGRLTGDVLVRGHNTRRARVGGLSSLVGLVFQDPESQLVTASVADEVAFGPENLGVSRLEIERRVDEALAATRLTGYDERDPHSLSGGEQQACVIAAIYAMHPEIYVMDEPLANLDPTGRAQVLRIVVEVAKRRGKTLILAEHSLDEVMPLVDRVVVMDGGRIVRQGTGEQVLAMGDIPRVFSRPPMARLGERLGFEKPPLTPEDLYRMLRERFRLPQRSHAAAAPAAPASGPVVIEVEDVAFSYGPGTAALKGVSLKVHEGEMVALLGRNGSGKTTLVRHMIGLLQPERGRVTVLGKNVAETPTHTLAREVGFCFQNPNHQLVAFKVREEIAFGLRAHEVDAAEIEGRVREALEFVGMSEYLEAEIFALGKGQKQRLALASVLALRPRILVIDEPTTGQDPFMAQEIFDVLRRLNQAGTTILAITHKIDLAAAYASRAVVLSQGQVAYDGAFPPLLSDMELMRRHSLEPPATTQLAGLLRDHGVPPWLSSYEELAQALAALGEASRGD
ncbi:MAG TPA: ABC transporter ATP-binding protein, partial [Anaerolineales bacterium]